ncbi:hypothetical protein CALVIDRAFT_561453 [Calocera viscosa TUFC12733]|uniref:Uncharacterized protein n=1 Tax=Calocera viscosa (strain TUFC12733) TaxID=1330018 RepID=A0A167FH40_CALVF|nr:hypothetical protein CALVIDRAFT_569882 [Calocera viscosa TUFC12733]KZO99039.1 hypothetical protein CALVIDRAFT_561453 [Calocera viscosa TUFC12733]
MTARPCKPAQYVAFNTNGFGLDIDKCDIYHGYGFVVRSMNTANERNGNHAIDLENWFYQHRGVMLRRVLDDNTFRDIPNAKGGDVPLLL